MAAAATSYIRTVGKSFAVFDPRKHRAAEKDPDRRTNSTRHAMLPPHTPKPVSEGPAIVPRVLNCQLPNDTQTGTVARWNRVLPGRVLQIADFLPNPRGNRQGRRLFYLTGSFPFPNSLPTEGGTGMNPNSLPSGEGEATEQRNCSLCGGWKENATEGPARKGVRYLNCSHCDIRQIQRGRTRSSRSNRDIGLIQEPLEAREHLADLIGASQIGDCVGDCVVVLESQERCEFLNRQLVDAHFDVLSEHEV